MRHRGFRGFFRDARNFLAFNVFGVTADFTQQRFRISEKLSHHCDYTVRYGPFAGMKLAQESWWSAADRGAMILGMYEAEVLVALDQVDRHYDTLVDVGAADGYYAIGCLKAGWVKHAYCFEISEFGRTAIQRNAELNGCSQQVTILGEAKSGFMDTLQNDFNLLPSKCMVIMDIEGGEEELLSKTGLASLSTSVSIVELHEHFISPGFLSNFERIAQSLGLRLEYLSTQARNPNAFPELSGWSDDDRWMLCSEGRMQLMRWALLTPGASSSLI